MSSKISFVEEATQSGANISALCRKHGISRQTGYKVLRLFEKHGYEGLEEKSRRPKSAPLATAEDIVAAILAERAKHPRWGARKLAVLLGRTFGELAPSERTVHRVLKRFGQIRMRRKPRQLSIVDRAPTVVATQPNDVLTIDFKGWWRTLDGTRCDPLTVRDAYSRYVLALVLVPQCTGERVRSLMLQLFRKHGVPRAIQCDNGPPFISAHARCGLTKLSAWWISLGIKIVRSRPASPQDNGGHERMHVDIAADLQADPESSFKRQQRACDRWRQVFNHVRPHEALKNKTPAEVYKSSPARLAVRPTNYPLTWLKRNVTGAGTVSVNHQQTFISTAVDGYQVGLQPLKGMRWRVWFYDLAIAEIELADVSARDLQGLAG